MFLFGFCINNLNPTFLSYILWKYKVALFEDALNSIHRQPLQKLEYYLHYEH